MHIAHGYPLVRAQVRDVHSADLSFIEHGTGMGPYLGVIGASFLKDSALTLDYARRVAVLQRLRHDTGVPLMARPTHRTGGTVVASVRYRGTSPNFPVFDAKLGGTPVRVMLDGGNPGASIDRAWLATLQASGAAMPFSYMDNEATYRLVRIGFSLLKHLGVTWNYRLQTMTFFTP